MWPFKPKPTYVKDPLYVVWGKIVVLWVGANAGYYLLLPALGIELSYNNNPVLIGGYFLLWAIVSAAAFWHLLSKWRTSDSGIWIEGVLSLAGAALIWGLLYAFSFLPMLRGPALAPYTDIIFATPWYFLPKSMDILLQQILVTVLVLDLHFRFRSFRKVIVGYLVFFVGAHLLFYVSASSAQHSTTMFLGAAFSTFIFPYLILHVRAGYILTYTIHLLFYIGLAMVLHAWPPPMYVPIWIS